MSSLASLLKEVRNCEICSEFLPCGIRPVLQVDSSAKILIAGQAPGRVVHETGIPFDDASGKRLREWMGVTSEEFYDSGKVAILPMAFCYPGKGKSGDLPPRKECAIAWREKLLQKLPNIRLTLLIGQYAQEYTLGKTGMNLTERVQAWDTFGAHLIPLPHPSPRNNIWLKRNSWFEKDVVPSLQERIKDMVEC